MEVGEMGEKGVVAELDLVVTMVVVEESVNCGGAMASIPRDVGV